MDEYPRRTFPGPSQKTKYPSPKNAAFAGPFGMTDGGKSRPGGENSSQTGHRPAVRNIQGPVTVKTEARIPHAALMPPLMTAHSINAPNTVLPIPQSLTPSQPRTAFRCFFRALRSLWAASRRHAFRSSSVRNARTRNTISAPPKKKTAPSHLAQGEYKSAVPPEFPLRDTRLPSNGGTSVAAYSPFSRAAPGRLPPPPWGRSHHPRPLLASAGRVLLPFLAFL